MEFLPDDIRNKLLFKLKSVTIRAVILNSVEYLHLSLVGVRMYLTCFHRKRVEAPKKMIHGLSL